MPKQAQHLASRLNSRLFVIPNRVLNFALKQVQGLSDRSIDFGISCFG
jgi:hypothetical protein